MEGQFRYTLDNFTVLQDEPLGWEEAKIVLKRNKEFGGIFYSYLGEYEFIGDGYQYINQQIQARGYCFSIKVLIEYRCNMKSAYETAFVGYINIKNAIIDNERKTVKANIEPDNVYAAFLSSSSNEYNLYTTTMRFPNGKVVTLNQDDKYYHNVETGQYDLIATKRSFYFRVFDVLNFLVQANTQGNLTVVSDFFTTAFNQINKWEVTLGGTTLAAGTINVTYVNQFGQFKTISQAFDTSEANTLNLLAEKLIEKTSSIVPTADINTKGFLRNYFTHVSWPAYNRTSRKIQLESWLPYQITNVSITSGTVGTTITAAETQAYQKGGGDLFITNQEQEAFYLSLPDIGDNRPISFDTLFKELDALFYLGIKLETVGDSFLLRIEPMEYFYSQAVLFRLEDVKDIKTSFNPNDNYNSVSVSSEGEYVTHTYALQAANSLIRGTSGNFFVEYSGPNPSTYLWKYITVTAAGGVIQPMQVIDVQPPVFPNLYYTFSFSTNLTATTGFEQFFLCQFTEKKNNVSLLNSKTVYPIADCIGDQLMLNNSYVTDIEYHGDQVSKDYEFTKMNGSSAPNSDKWSFAIMDVSASPSLDRSKVYKAMIKNGTDTFTRYVFNGHLTNHHKIRNNSIRIKEDCFFQPKDSTESGGQLLRYINTADVKPLQIHEFDYFLSYNQILSLIQNPDVMLEIDVSNDENYSPCWIEEIEMTLNTKSTRIKLYEN